MSPIGFITIIFLILVRPNKSKPNMIELFVTSAALFSLLITFWINPELGAPRDWDVFSFLGFPLTFSGAYKLAKWQPAKFNSNSILYPTILLIILLLGPNIYEKQNITRAIMHLDKMLSADIHLMPEYKDGSRSLIWGMTVSNFPETIDRLYERFEKFIRRYHDKEKDHRKNK